MPVGRAFPTDAHVSAAHHLSVLAMDCDGDVVSPAKMRTVARMIDIAMRQDDEAQVLRRPAARSREFGVELVLLVREARVDEDIAVLDIDEIAVDAEVDPADSADHAAPRRCRHGVPIARS